MPNLLQKGKSIFYQNVKPTIDKMLTNPTAMGLVAGVPGLVTSYLYKPDFDARQYKTQDEAYSAARKTGAKTFIWNGGHYNTDYKGNPNKTLVQQKQEELDTYGITNEQTQDKSLLTERLHKNLIPLGYESPMKRFFKTVILNKQEDEGFNMSGEKERVDLFNLLTGYPQKHNSLGISKYKPTLQKENLPYYYKMNNPMYGNDFTNTKESIKLKPGQNIVSGFSNLGDATIGRGKDYLSYSDNWDINPFKGKSTHGSEKINKIIPGINLLGKPLNIYDRKYFNKPK